MISSHSSVVTLELLFGQRRIPIAQMCSECLIAVEAIELPIGEGVVLMHVDGKPTMIPVYLPNGCNHGEQEFRISHPPKDEVS